MRSYRVSAIHLESIHILKEAGLVAAFLGGEVDVSESSSASIHWQTTPVHLFSKRK